MANKSELNIIILGTDKTKKAFSSVGKGMTNLKKVGTAAVLGIGAAVAGAGIAVVGFGIKAIQAGGDAAEMLGKFEVTFGDMTESLTSDLDKFSKATGRSKFELLEMSANMGSVLKGMGLTEDQTADLAKQYTQLAVDVGSFNNLPSEVVAQKFTAALTGEYESLKSLGIVIKQVDIDQQLLNMGIEGGAKAATEMQLVQARTNLIMEKSTDAQGDAIRTAGSYANQMVGLKATFSDLTTEIGLKLLPIITPLLSKFREIASDVMPKVLDVVGGVITIFSDFFARLSTGEDIVGTISNLFYNLALQFGVSKERASELFFKIQNVVETLLALKDRVLEIVTPIAEFIIKNVKLQDVLVVLGIAIMSVVVPAVISLVASMLPIIATIAAVMAIVVLLRKVWETDFGGIRTFIINTWEQFLKPTFEKLQKWFVKTLPKAISKLKDFWVNTLKPAIKTVWDFIQNSIFPLFITLAAWLSVTIPAAISTLSDFWTNTLKPAIDAVWKFISTYLIPIFKDITELVGVLLVAASVALQLLWENVLQPALETVWAFIQDKVIPILQDLAEWLEGPLEVAGQIAVTLFDNFKLGLVAVRDAIKWVIDKVKILIDWLSKLFIPKNLEPGSASPFEKSLWGIGAAMDSLAQKSLPNLTAQLELQPRVAGLAGGMPADGVTSQGTGGGISNTYNLTAEYKYQDERTLMNEIKMQQQFGRYA